MVNLTREKNARAFLFGMLTLVIIFVSVVCVVINNRNDKIISGASIGETDNIEEAADNISIDDENIEKPWLAGSEEARKEVVGKVIEVNARFGIVVVDLGAMTRVIQWLGNKNTQVDPKIENGMKLNIVRNFDTPDVKLIVKGAEVTNVADRCSIVEVAADDIANVKVGDTVIVDFVK